MTYLVHFSAMCLYCPKTIILCCSVSLQDQSNVIRTYQCTFVYEGIRSSRVDLYNIHCDLCNLGFGCTVYLCMGLIGLGVSYDKSQMGIHLVALTLLYTWVFCNICCEYSGTCYSGHLISGHVYELDIRLWSQILIHM